MTELCLTNTNTNNNNENNKFSSLGSFVISLLLYFSYLIFFSPYLYKLLSFLSPLFFTTFLLVLALITTLIPLHSVINSKDGVFLTAYYAVLEKLRPHFEGEEECEKVQPIEESEVYKVVFDVPIIELTEENPVESDKFGENPDEISVEKVCVHEEGTMNKRKSMSLEQETGDTNPKKLEEVEVKTVEETVQSCGSEVTEVKKTPKFGSLSVDNDTKFTPQTKTNHQNLQYIGNYGSMRKEKEWRRTLACKLFEERHNWSNNKINVDGDDSDEGMDLLWETPEADICRGKSKDEVSKKVRKNGKIEDLMKNDCYGNNEDDYDQEYDDGGKICCLQALKLSAGKMNLSVGKPNLVKISKVFKGIGWLHTHVKRHGKKGYN